MTCYYLSREGREIWSSAYGTQRDKLEAKHVKTFRGKVTLTKYRDAVMRKEGRAERFTLFDDSTPPRLIQCDYPLAVLHKLGFPIPDLYVDLNGDIVRVTDWDDTFTWERKEVVMKGSQEDLDSYEARERSLARS